MLAMQPCIQAVGMQQLGVRALLADLAIGNHHHTVGMFDGGQAVCNHDGGAPAHQLAQGFLHQPFRFVVQRRGGFIQDEDGRVLVNGAGNRQSLALAA